MTDSSSASYGAASSVSEALRGLWSRDEIFTPSGYRDDSTRVRWLQTQRFYADIRVPADRPSISGAGGFADCSDAVLISLGRVQGFAGVLAATPDMCFWRRDLDYHPPGDTPDEGRYEIDGDRMAEYGVHAEYTEIWRRDPDSASPLLALSRAVGPQGLLVIAGDHFLEIIGRDEPTPAGGSLSEVIERDLAAGRRDLAEGRLNMRICYGRRTAGARPWTIELSTLPWLEGTSLFAGESLSFDSGRGVLSAGAGGNWVVEDSSLPSDEIAGVFG